MKNESSTKAYPSPVFLVLAASVYLFAYSISVSSLYADESILSTALLLDLVLTAPILYYLAIRRTRIPRITVAIVVLLGFLFAYSIVPETQKDHVALVSSWLLPALEVAVFGFVVYKTVQLTRKFRNDPDLEPELHTAIRTFVADNFGDSFLTRAISYEISVICHCFFPNRSTRSNGFFYHKNRGSKSLYGVVAFIIIAETIAVHLLVALWSPVAAWILTALSLYFLLFLTAHFRALAMRPIRVEGGKLLFRFGLLLDAEIELSDIEDVRRIAVGQQDEADREASLLAGFEQVNLMLVLERKHVGRGPYGAGLSFRRLAFFADEPEMLLKGLER